MTTRVVVLGAGFGGLELATILSETFGEAIDLVLIDRSDAFVFGFSKLDVMFGRVPPESVRHPYRSIARPGVRLVECSQRGRRAWWPRRVSSDRVEGRAGSNRTRAKPSRLGLPRRGEPGPPAAARCVR